MWSWRYLSGWWAQKWGAELLAPGAQREGDFRIGTRREGHVRERMVWARLRVPLQTSSISPYMCADAQAKAGGRVEFHQNEGKAFSGTHL